MGKPLLVGTNGGDLVETGGVPPGQDHARSSSEPTLVAPGAVSEADILSASHRMLAEARDLLAEARRTLDAPGVNRLGPLTRTLGRPRPGPPQVRRRAATIVTALPAAAGLLLLGVALTELRSGSTQPAAGPDQPRAAAVVRGARTASPSTSYGAAPPPAPLWVSVPNLGTTAQVTAMVGVEPSGPEKGLLTAPPNYHDLGWFRHSSASLLVIDGHVGYRQDPGPLAFIGRLSVGDLVVLGTQNGTEMFRVQRVGRAVKGQLPAGYFTAAYARDLMLITCDYTSPFSAGHYADNVYVVAVPTA